MDANDQPINPTGTEDLIPREAETETPAGPATAEYVSQEDQEIADLKATMESESATPDEKEQARRGFQDRMERKELRKQAEEAKIEAAEERGRRKALETVQTPPATPQVPQGPPQFSEPEPKLEDFTKKDEDGFEVPDMAGFVSKHTDWGIRKYAWEQNQVEETRRSQEWGQKGEAQKPGFLKKAQSLSEKLAGPLGMAMGQAITSSDVSHELVIYLADNPSELSRLMSVPGPRALAELGKIEARIATVKAGNSQKTNAPNPGEPLKPSTGVETFDPMKADAHTYAVKFHPATPEWIKNKA